METNDAVPIWNPSTLFEYGFEADERGSWDDSDYTTTTTNPIEGLRSGIFAGKKYALKRINNAERLYWRVAFRLTDIDGDRTLILLTSNDATVLKLSYWSDGPHLRITVGDTLVAYWTSDTADHTLEWYTDLDADTVTVWLDGNEVVADKAATIAGNYYELTIGSAASGTTFLADCIKVDTFRIGLPGAITPPTERYDYDVAIDDVGYNLYREMYQEQDISGFAPRLGTGDVGYSDLSGFQHLYIPSLHHGLGQTEMTGVGQGDIAAYAQGSSADLTGVGVMRGYNTITTRADITVTSGLNDIDTRLTGTAVGLGDTTYTVFGIGFPAAKVSGSYVSLLKVTDDAATSSSFTSTLGVRDVLYNGAYAFVTLGGARMKKSADLSTWTDAGDDTNQPTDMGRMAMYNGFLWVAYRDLPILGRAAESDASDLERTTDAEPPTTIRVGPGSIPINALCPYLGRLYVGREDGLYYVVQEDEVVNAYVVETFPRSAYNCRDMVVHNGYLVYATGSRVYRFSGESKQDITPGPIQPFADPPVSIRYWLSLAVINGYLYAWGYATSGTYLLVYNGVGWHQVTTAGASDGVGVAGAMVGEPRAYYAQVYDATGSIKAKVASASSLLGDERPVTSSYATEWTIYTPWYSMGMPSVAKLFRLVRVLVDDFPDYVDGEEPYISIDYRVKTPQGEETGTIGSIIQSDCDFIAFKPGVLGNKIRLTITVKHPATKPLVIRGFVLQYIDRPEPVWGYDMTLLLPNTQREFSGEPGTRNVLALKQHLRNVRGKESYVRLRDRDGAICDGFISSGPRFNLVGGESVARLTFMVVKRYLHTPAASGGPTITLL
jgi:hypothetical protein